MPTIPGGPKDMLESQEREREREGEQKRMQFSSFRSESHVFKRISPWQIKEEQRQNALRLGFHAVLPTTMDPDEAFNANHGDDDDSDLLEICVESLVGTVFEMRLSGHETVGNIKARLQRLEGIPRAHMHLLYRGEKYVVCSWL